MSRKKASRFFTLLYAYIKHASVKGYSNVLKGALLEATERSGGWKKGLGRHKETWWWNDVSNSDGRSENREMLVRRSIQKQRKK